jgi:hypothetical protein
MAYSKTALLRKPFPWVTWGMPQGYDTILNTLDLLTLHPELRLKAYRAISRHIRARPKVTPTGLCLYIDEVIFDFGLPHHVEVTIMDYLPELNNQKPKETYDMAYWWNPNDQRVRLKALDEAIKETKLLISSNKTSKRIDYTELP